MERGVSIRFGDSEVADSIAGDASGTGCEAVEGYADCTSETGAGLLSVEAKRKNAGLSCQRRCCRVGHDGCDLAMNCLLLPEHFRKLRRGVEEI